MVGVHCGAHPGVPWSSLPNVGFPTVLSSEQSLDSCLPTGGRESKPQASGTWLTCTQVTPTDKDHLLKFRRILLASSTSAPRKTADSRPQEGAEGMIPFSHPIFLTWPS